MIIVGTVLRLHVPVRGLDCVEAGLQLGDVLTEINGEKVGDGHAGMRLITDTRPGETVTLGLLRGKQALKVSTQVAMRPEQQTSS